jgi:hypothetical protein
MAAVINAESLPLTARRSDRTPSASAGPRKANGDGPIAIRAAGASQSGWRLSQRTTASTSEVWKLKAGL